MSGVFGLQKEVSKNEIVKAVNDNLKPNFDELKKSAEYLSGEFNKLGNRVTAVETKLEAIDKYVLRDLKARAAKILGTPDVGC